MKTLIPILVTAGALLTVGLRAQDNPPPVPAGNPPENAAVPGPPASPPGQPATATLAEPASPVPPMEVSPPPTRVVAEGERGLRLNFRNAPLELVLNYLSEAAGFIIVPEVDVRGRVDVWSNQPLTKDEAIEVLNQALVRNGYAVLRDGRTLTVVTREEARKRDIPVRRGAIRNPSPKTTRSLPKSFPSASSMRCN